MSQVKSLLELVNSTDPAMLNVIIANVVTRNKNGSNDEYNKDTSIAKQKAKRLMRHDQI